MTHSFKKSLSTYKVTKGRDEWNRYSPWLLGAEHTEPLYSYIYGIHSILYVIRYCITPWKDRASLVAQKVKRLPAMRETWVRFLGREDPLEKEMAIHPSTLAWKIPWSEEPDRLKSMGSQRVGYDWATSLMTGQPTPVFLPGKSHGQRSLVAYSPWDGKESDTTEQLSSNSIEWFYIPNTVLSDLSM